MDYPETREHIGKIGAYINWHGSLTVDFIYRNGVPYYIECNPRMIEPANAAIAGVNFAEILISLAAESCPDKALVGKAGIKTHSTMALLLGAAEKTGKRKDIVKMFWNGVRCKGNLAGSTEILTPFRKDLMSVIPLLATFSRLLNDPRKAKFLAQQAVGDYCVLPKTIEAIRSERNEQKM